MADEALRLNPDVSRIELHTTRRTRMADEALRLVGVPLERLVVWSRAEFHLAGHSEGRAIVTLIDLR